VFSIVFSMRASRVCSAYAPAHLEKVDDVSREPLGVVKGLLGDHLCFVRLHRNATPIRIPS
jgi:hypothetical protein